MAIDIIRMDHHDVLRLITDLYQGAFITPGGIYVEAHTHLLASMLSHGLEHDDPGKVNINRLSQVLQAHMDSLARSALQGMNSETLAQNLHADICKALERHGYRWR